MKWGFFTPTHILTLMLAALMVAGLYYGLKNKSQKIQTLVLFPLSLSGIAAIVFNLLRWGEPLAYLPLHTTNVKYFYIESARMVTINPAEGEGETILQIVRKGQKYTLPECPYTAPAGKQFYRWYLAGTDFYREIAVASRTSATNNGGWL